MRMSTRYFANLDVLSLLTDVGNTFFAVSRILSTDTHHAVMWYNSTFFSLTEENI